jgi:cell division protein FtsQ
VQKNWTHIAKRVALFLIVPAIVLAFVGANYLNKNNVCKEVLIHIKNKDAVQFVTSADVKSALVNANSIVPNSTKLKDINIAQLEAIAFNNPWVKDANIYVDHHDNINVDITQKEPILRWLNGDLVQSYLDADGNTIPVNPNYGANVPIVTSANMGATVKEQKMKYQMVALCNFIKQDTFWNATIAQINITKQFHFELVPSLGNHIILFGDTTNMRNKFARLFTFYKEVMPRDGWAKFNQLNLQFDGQIVAMVNDSMQIINEKKGLNPLPVKTLLSNVIPKSTTTAVIKTIAKKQITKTKVIENETAIAKKAKENLKALVAKSTKPTSKNNQKEKTKIVPSQKKSKPEKSNSSQSK